MDHPSKSSSMLEYTFRATRFRLRLAELGAAILLMLALGIAGSLAIVVADHVASGGLNVWTRWTLRWILIGSEAVLLIALIALPLLRRISNLYAARQMEKSDSSFHNDLTAAVQLHAKAGPAAATAAAVRRSAAQQVARMVNGAPIQKRSLKLAALAAAAAVAMFCLYWISAPKSTMVSLRRAMGIGNPPAPTRTEVLSFTPDDGTTVLTGNEVTFEARLRSPQGPAVLSIARDGHTILDEDVLTMTPIDEPGPGEAYRVTWKAAAADGWAKFRLNCGDAETIWRRLRVLPTPTLRRVRVQCDWPKYTHLPARISEGGRVEGPVGTRATVTAEVNLPVTRASLVFEADGRSLRMTPDETGRLLSTSFTVNKSGQYVIHYKLRDINVEAKSIPHEVAVTPDRPPTIRLDQPAGETTLAQNESLGVLCEVADDFGVGRVELVCTTKDGRSKSHSLLQQPAPGVSSRQVRSDFQADALGRAGDTLTCVVRARDLNPAVSGGQTAQSKPFTLTITPPQTTAEQQETAEDQGRDEEQGEETVVAAVPGSDALDAQKLDQLCAAMRTENDETDQNDNGSQEQPAGTKEKSSTASKAGESGDSSQQKPGGASAASKTDGNSPAKKNASPDGEQKTEATSESSSREQDQASPKTQCNHESDGSVPGKCNAGQKSSDAQKKDGNASQADKDSSQSSSESKCDSSQPGSSKQKTSEKQRQCRGKGQGQDQGQGRNQGQQEGQGRGQQGDGAQSPAGAQNVHDGQNPGLGSEPREGELEAVDEETLMPGTVLPLESVGMALDRAHKQIEGNTVDPKLLEAMGMSLPEFKGFVEKYSAEYKKALQKRENQKHALKALSSAGPAEVQHGETNKTGNVTGDPSLEKKRAEKDRRMSPAKVSPEYQKQLEAYLRAVSESNEK
jgi:hypothetical protein